MKTLIENTILILAVIVLSTFMITSIEKADSHVGYGYKTEEEKLVLKQQYLDFVEGRE